MEVGKKKLELNYRLKVTTHKQFDQLIKIMQKLPYIAKGMKFAEAMGYSKDRYNKKWDVITTHLNSLGPPQRKSSEWQKVWSDFKLKVKKKIEMSKNHVKISGIPVVKINNISPLEEKVLKILSFNSNQTSTVTSSQNAHSVIIPSTSSQNVTSGDPVSSLITSSRSILTPMSLRVMSVPKINSMQNQIINNQQISVNSANNLDNKPDTTTSKEQIQKIEDLSFMKTLLEKQIECLEKIANVTRENCEYSKKLFDLNIKSKTKLNIDEYNKNSNDTLDVTNMEIMDITNNSDNESDHNIEMTTSIKIENDSSDYYQVKKPSTDMEKELTPIIKNIKTEDDELEIQPLSLTLKNLNETQLIQIIDILIKQQPDLEGKIRNAISLI